MARPKRGRPYNPVLDEYRERVRASDDAKRRDRRVKAETEALKKAKLFPLLIKDPFGDEITVMRATRTDPLAALHARHHISESQYQGGRTFQYDFECAERGPRAIDPSKEFVDGGLMPEPITEAQRKAVVRLNQVQRSLGLNGSSLTYGVLIEGRTIDQICELRGLTTQRENDYIGKRFRECLDELAKFYGFAMVTKV